MSKLNTIKWSFSLIKHCNPSYFIALLPRRELVVLWWIVRLNRGTVYTWKLESSREISPSTFSSWLPFKTLRKVQLTSRLTVHTDFIILWLWTQSVTSEKPCHFTMGYQLPQSPQANKLGLSVLSAILQSFLLLLIFVYQGSFIYKLKTICIYIQY